MQVERCTVIKDHGNRANKKNVRNRLEKLKTLILETAIVIGISTRSTNPAVLSKSNKVRNREQEEQLERLW